MACSINYVVTSCKRPLCDYSVANCRFRLMCEHIPRPAAVEEALRQATAHLLHKGGCSEDLTAEPLSQQTPHEFIRKVVAVVGECVVIAASVLLSQSLHDVLESSSRQQYLPNVAFRLEGVFGCFGFDHDYAGIVLLRRDYGVAELHGTG